MTLLANASVVIFGSLLLGLACGVLLDRLGRLHDEAATMPVLQLALVILAALLAIAWGLSPFVTLLVAGMTARSRMRHRLTVEPYLGSAGAALTVMLFVSFGVLSTLRSGQAVAVGAGDHRARDWSARASRSSPPRGRAACRGARPPR